MSLVKKIISTLFIILILTLTGLYFLASDSLTPKPLSISKDILTTQVLKLGEFSFTLDTEQLLLSITHNDYGDRFVFQSVAKKSFVLGAYASESVHEERGMFTLDDHRQFICTEQAIDHFDLNNQQVSLSGQLKCSHQRSYPYQLTFSVDQGQLSFDLTLDQALSRSFLHYASDESGIFGLGTQFTHANVKGHRVPIFVMEQGIGRGAQPITTGANLSAGAGGNEFTSYAVSPYYLTNQNRGLMLQTYAYSIFDFSYDDSIQLEIFDHTVKGHFFIDDSLINIIKTYTHKIGRMRALPDWVHNGVILGIQGGQEKVSHIIQHLIDIDVPIAGVWLQDWVGQRTTSFGQQLWWNWQLDQQRYPDWPSFRQQLNDQGIKVLTYINPFLAAGDSNKAHSRSLYMEALEQDFLVKNAQGEPYLILNTSFSAGLLDLTNPDAIKWFKTVMQDEVLSIGTDGWMADFGEALPYDAQLASGISAKLYHNQYPEVWAKLNREVVDAQENADDLLFFTRSGFQLSPQYSTLFWLGDQLVSFDEYDGIKTAVTGLVSSGFSGYSLNHSDIGGYTTISNPLKNYHRSEELLIRWLALNAFTAVFRSHEGNQPNNNVQVYSTPRTRQALRFFAGVFKALGPYRKQLVQQARDLGLPVVRHPSVHFPDDDTVRDFSYQAFMLGDVFWVAPVLDSGIEQQAIYLPKGHWQSLFSDEQWDSQGQWFEMNTPLDQIPVFYPKGHQYGIALKEVISTLKSFD